MAKKVKAKTSKKKVKLAHNIQVIAEGKDEWGRRYFLLGDGTDPIPNLGPILASRLVTPKRTEILAELVNAGVNLFTSPSRTLLSESIQLWGSQEATIKVATKVGWNGKSYVLPDKIFNRQRNVYARLDELQDVYDAMAKYRVSKNDSLKDWQKKIGKFCINNSRPMFSVSLAFTGPILRFVQGPRSGGFQIYGRAESGKSTAAMVAGSVWGCHRQSDLGFLESWNTTANAVEVTALAHNDGLLILDETKKVDSNPVKRVEVILNVTMRLSEQREKKRLSTAAANRSWRCYFLSTSNYSLAELAAKAGVEIDDADRGRLVDIPLPAEGHGIYEDLHGFSSGMKLTDYLKSQCRRHYGHPSREFLTKLLGRLVIDGNVDALQKGLRKARRTYLDDLAKQPKLVAPLNRASSRFATVYAAGALAINLGVLNWDRRALEKAILSCQLDELKRPKINKDESSIKAMDSKLKDYFRQTQAKAMDLRKSYADPKTHRFGSVPWYTAKHKGQQYIYLMAEALKSIIGSGEGASQYKQSLVDRGRLDVSSGGAGGRRFVVERRIFKGTGKQGMKWVHAFKLGPVKTFA